MRPIKVEFQAFGPYRGHEVVDFEAISKKGLFLICGKTGIGKTMILDAITFALYGKSSGHGRDVFSNMRCTNADSDTDTFVLFEFENNGDFFQFERRLQQKRVHLSESYNLQKKDGEGRWQVLFENPKEKNLNEKAVEIIGLDYEQFRQVIILPQGQFEKFLTSDSNDKEKILTNIFGEEKWQTIADNLYIKASSRKESLKTLKEKITNSLQEENCENITELKDLIAHKKEELVHLDEAAKEASFDKQILLLNDTLVIIGRFNDLKKAKEKVSYLESLNEEIENTKKELEDGIRAAKLRTLIETKDVASRELFRREAEEKDIIVLTGELEQKVRSAEEELKNFSKKEEKIEEQKELKIQYELKRNDYENIDRINLELKKLTEEEKKNIDIEKAAKAKWDSFTQKVSKCRDQYVRQSEEHTYFLNQYISGIKGELAKELEEGKACPVCGSITHPSPALVSDSGVSKDMVEEKKLLMDEAYRELQEMLANRDEAQKKYDEKRELSHSCHEKCIETESKLNSVKGNLVAGISSLRELEETIFSLDMEIKTYAETKSSLEKKVEECRNRYTLSKAKIEPAHEEKENSKNAYEEASKNVYTGLADNGFKSEEEARGMLIEEETIEILRKKVSDYGASLSAAKEAVVLIEKELEGKEEPDEPECREKIAIFTKEKSAYERNRAVLENEIERLVNKQKNLEKDGEDIEERMKIAEEDFGFAKRLRGDTGTGLRRYVLGVLFSSVVSSANQMLEKVHGGRYRLYRSDQKAQGTNKTGLELKVYDKNSEEHEGRFVSTLSGGEKFLVSLALSIGMSTVAQKSGIKISALFIDEGFGSLDEESISDAMDILNTIQEANGLVGIISHVQILQDRIMTKLKVESKDGSSHIVQSIG